MPKGEWIDYWTGQQIVGGKSIVADAAVDVLPLYVRSGAVIAKIPEDVMTLVPPAQSGNHAIASPGDRRVYEVCPGATDAFTDFEGRTVQREAAQLTITGRPARMIVRWRFLPVHSATVNGAAVHVQQGAEGPFVEFEHKDKSVVAWQ
jgi:hypothetical protein